MLIEVPEYGKRWASRRFLEKFYLVVKHLLDIFFQQIKDPRVGLGRNLTEKDRLEMAQLLRDGQHLLCAQRLAIGKNGEAVARIGRGCKDIAMDIVEGRGIC